MMNFLRSLDPNSSMEIRYDNRLYSYVLHYSLTCLYNVFVQYFLQYLSFRLCDLIGLR